MRSVGVESSLVRLKSIHNLRTRSDSPANAFFQLSDYLQMFLPKYSFNVYRNSNHGPVAKASQPTASHLSCFVASVLRGASWRFLCRVSGKGYPFVSQI